MTLATVTASLEKLTSAFGVCLLQGEAGTAPVDEFHDSAYGTSRAAEYRLWDDGRTARQDFIAWFTSTEVLSSAQADAAPTPTCDVTWTDAEGNERDRRIVDVVSRDLTIQVVAGLGGIDSRVGATVILKESTLSRNLPSNLYVGQQVTPTTDHATNGPSGADLLTIPTTDSVGTIYEATVEPNSTGFIGIHAGVNWAVDGTPFDLEGDSVVSIGRYLLIQSVAFTYRRYYTCASVPPLRQNQRDDIKQGQRTSRQLTVRQVGYL